MKQEAEKHFKPARYARYPLVGSFRIAEPTGDIQRVTLWHNGKLGQEKQPSFFEEESPDWGFAWGVPKGNRMTRDNYNNLLTTKLFIPQTEEPINYVPERVVYVAQSGHNITVERTKPTLPEKQQHRRIRRIKSANHNNVPTFNRYSNLVDALRTEKLITPEDFGHWIPQPPFGAKKELRTRINLLRP